ncbi:MAG: histidine triad nucleotide-binding protein [Gudongella sp.]|jgi:histidine triad (HIT) family protein|nr:histidine triad nucleotide-binding protein [Gudongella sp.]
MDCLFCKIADRKIPADLIYEDEHIVAFKDINPQAPVHFLVVPRLHIDSLDKISKENDSLMAHILRTIPALAKEQGIENGYRVVNNCGEDGGQTVDHIHFHVLGQREMLWPPG